jgi:hypothetical protein
VNVGASGSPAGLSRRPISTPTGFAPARIAEQHQKGRNDLRRRQDQHQVRDQDAARRCWIETMGFSLVTDEPIGEEPGGARWIEGPAATQRRHPCPVQPHVRRQQARLTVPGAVHLR